MFRKDHTRPQPGAIRSVAALADPVETVAGSHDPGIRGWTFQIFPKVLEHGWRLRRERGEVIDGFIYTGGQTRGRHVVAQNPTIHNLREKSSLWEQFTHQVRNVFLAFGRKCFLIASSPAKGDNHNFSFQRRGCSTSPWGGHPGAPQRHSSGAAQKITASTSKTATNLLRIRCVHRCHGAILPGRYHR